MQIVRLFQNVVILTRAYCCHQYAQFPVCKFYTFKMTAFVQSFSLKVSRVHMYSVHSVHCTRLLRVHFMRILSKIVVCLDLWFSCKILRLESLSFHVKNHLKRKTVFYSSFDEYTFKTFIFSSASNIFKYFITPILNNVWRNFQLYTTIRVVVPLKTDYPI